MLVTPKIEWGSKYVIIYASRLYLGKEGPIIQMEKFRELEKEKEESKGINSCK